MRAQVEHGEGSPEPADRAQYPAEITIHRCAFVGQSLAKALGVGEWRLRAWLRPLDPGSPTVEIPLKVP